MADIDTSGPAVRIERTLDAPVELIWQMWTTPEHFSAWYGPPGASIVVAEMDVRVGGKRLVGMTMNGPNGQLTMWFAGEHLEIVEHQRLVYTESMADETGAILSPPDMGMPADHPAVTEITVELATVGGRTTMTMTHAGIPEGSPGASGWAMAFDKLAAYVAQQTAR